MFARILDTPKKRIAVGVVGPGRRWLGRRRVRRSAARRRRRLATTTTTTTTTAPTTTTTVPVPVAPLTGLPGDYGDRLGRPARVVKIDNAPTGPARRSASTQADVVFEERVEGSITRLAAVFHSTDAAESVRCGRPARPTPVSWACSAGRSTPGRAATRRLNILHKSSAVDVGHDVSGGGFVRQPGRPAPHNLFTTLAALYAKAPERTPAAEAAVHVPVRGRGATGVGRAPRLGGRPQLRRPADLAGSSWDGAVRAVAPLPRRRPHVDSAGIRSPPRTSS